MSKPIAISLIVIFCIHFIVFIHLYIKRKRIHDLFLAGAFIWLILSQAMGLWGVDLALYGISAHALFRTAAWITTGMGLLLYLHYRFISVKKRESGG